MKKGFTLIELLAVIVILAIIALIATPIVLDIINDAKQSSTLRSVDNILKGAELYVSKGLMDNKNLSGNIYEEVMKIIDGENPDSGNIYANKKGEVAFSFKYNGYCYTKGYEDTEIKVEKTDTCIAPIDYLMVANQTNGETETFFEGPITKSTVEKIYTVTTNIVPSGVIGSWDVSESQNGSIMAWYKDEDNNGSYELYIGQDGGVKANSNSSKLFNYFLNVLEMDLSNLDTSNVTNMLGMFQRCEQLSNLNISNFNTSNVTNMKGMFSKCISLTSLDLKHFDTSNVVTMQAMLQTMTSLTNLDVSSFNTSNVTDMAYMFLSMSSIINLDISNFDTSNVTTMNSMFAGMKSIKTIDINHFNTSNVTDMSFMFGTVKDGDTCASLENLDLSNFDTSKVTTVQGMFKGTKALKKLELNNATFVNVKTFSGMFLESSVSNIIVKDSDAKTFIEARLTDSGLSGTVTISQ